MAKHLTFLISVINRSELSFIQRCFPEREGRQTFRQRFESPGRGEALRTERIKHIRKTINSW